MNQNAVNYLQENKEKYSKEILIKQLQNSGYGEEDINEAVGVVFGNDTTQSAVQIDGNATSEIKYAGFWVRAAAYVIDYIIIMIASGIVGFIFGIFIAASGAPDELSIVASLISIVLAYGYLVFMTNKYQATLGKMALGLKVISEEGQQATLGKIIMREVLGKFLSGITLGIGFIMAGFTQRKQALHDMMASTVVVYKDPSKKIKGWVIAVIVAVVMVPIFGIFASIVLVSLSSARSSAQDAAVKATISSHVPEALVYYDENKSFEGFRPTRSGEGSMTECLAFDPVVNIAPDGQSMAVFGKLCSKDDAYFCADTSSNSNGIGSTAEVDEAFVKSGKTSCE